jgi:cytoplasmic iron level regulating protein YaaA (DUF328/UPF0246 family)
MLLLLPPSEGKTDPANSGPTLDISTLAFPELSRPRRSVLDALIRLSYGPRKRALSTLGISERQASQIVRNQGLLTAPCAHASDVYTGVLFAALDLPNLTAPRRRRADKHVAIASSLFGFVRPNSLIPAYRCSGGTTLPQVGRVSSYWRAQVPADTFAGQGPILDLRSGTYASFMPLPTDDSTNAMVKVWQDSAAGTRTAVTHFSKQTKGEVARCILNQGRMPRSVAEVVECLRDHGWNAQLTDLASGPPRLDVVLKSS